MADARRPAARHAIWIILCAWLVLLCLIPQQLWLRWLPAVRWTSLGLTLALWWSCWPAPLLDGGDVPVLLFGAALIPSALLAQAPALALTGQLDGRPFAWIGYGDLVGTGCLWYLLAKHTITTAQRRQHLARWWLIVAVLVAVIGWTEMVTHHNVIFERWVPFRQYAQFIRQPRMMSTQGQPIIVGTLLIVALPLALIRVQAAATVWRRCGWALVVACLASAVVLTFSRGSLIALTVAAGSCTLAVGRRAWLLGLLIAVCAVVIAASAWSHNGRNADVAGVVRYSVQGLRHAGGPGRWDRAALAWRMARDHPLWGVGLNHYRLLFDRYRPGNVVPKVMQIPDNMYLTLLAETGWLGLVAFGWLVWRAGRRWHRTLALLSDPADRGVWAALGAGWFGLLANMLTYDALLWLLPLAVFWLWLGALHHQDVVAHA